MRGYERSAVDAYVARVADMVAELEATQLRETVVQRALDEVGEQTSSILQQAHETADEIASRSKAQAEGRLQRAEAEAEAVRREADDYAQRISEDMRELWEERGRLIEDLRRYAEEVLGVADDALERLQEPGRSPDANGNGEGAIDQDPTPAAEGEDDSGEYAEEWAEEPAESDTAEVPAAPDAGEEVPEPPGEQPDPDATVEFRVPGRESP